ncbi:phosphoglycerate kinase [bacterium]|nr:phosphoglycerate kinase [bacterium]
MKILPLKEGNRVLLRVDFNVPIKDGKITDTRRIDATLPTINFLLEKKVKVIIMAHLGRPAGIGYEEKFSLKPIYEKLKEYFPQKIFFCKSVLSDDPVVKIKEMDNGSILLLENLRFYMGEKENNFEFIRKLALLGDYYVNDAFGVVHRKHASVYGVPKMFDSEKKAYGFLIEKELNYLHKKLKDPQRPYTIIMGGAKVGDKIKLIKRMIDKADHILIGGGMMFTFLGVQGNMIGKSLFEYDKKDIAKEILEKGKDKIVLPTDSLVVDNIENPNYIEEKNIKQMSRSDIGVDIGNETIENFRSIIEKSKTIVFNGPMGIFEDDRYANGTREIVAAIADCKGVSIVGGGDSAASIKKFGLEDKISHISTGGGASLELLSGKDLPGLKALE